MTATSGEHLHFRFLGCNMVLVLAWCDFVLVGATTGLRPGLGSAWCGIVRMVILSGNAVVPD